MPLTLMNAQTGALDIIEDHLVAEALTSGRYKPFGSESTGIRLPERYAQELQEEGQVSTEAKEGEGTSCPAKEMDARNPSSCCSRQNSDGFKCS